jgi:3-oxoacyl-[acyl-carrier-protein] synthase II
VLILEHLESALDRGATIHGEIIGYGMSADAFHMTQPPEGGEGARRAMEVCLADADLAPTDVEYINSHGTATPHGDIAETVAVKELFGDHAGKLVMNSTKSMTGHLLGAAGGLEFTVCILVMKNGIIPPTINNDNPDPLCDLDCAPNKAVERDVSVSLTNSFGFGGHNVSLAVRRFEG